MAVSPQQITQERDEAFQKKIAACEAEIDALLRREWKERDFTGRLSVIDITQILNAHSQVREDVLRKYEAAGWRVDVKSSATYDGLPRLFSLFVAPE